MDWDFSFVCGDCAHRFVERRPHTRFESISWRPVRVQRNVLLGNVLDYDGPAVEKIFIAFDYSVDDGVRYDSISIDRGTCTGRAELDGGESGGVGGIVLFGHFCYRHFVSYLEFGSAAARRGAYRNL